MLALCYWIFMARKLFVEVPYEQSQNWCKVYFSKRHKEKRQKDKGNGNFKSKQKNGLKNRQKKESKGDEM